MSRARTKGFYIHLYAAGVVKRLGDFLGWRDGHTGGVGIEYFMRGSKYWSNVNGEMVQG